MAPFGSRRHRDVLKPLSLATFSVPAHHGCRRHRPAHHARPAMDTAARRVHTVWAGALLTAAHAGDLQAGADRYVPNMRSNAISAAIGVAAQPPMSGLPSWAPSIAQAVGRSRSGSVASPLQHTAMRAGRASRPERRLESSGKHVSGWCGYPGETSVEMECPHQGTRELWNRGPAQMDCVEEVACSG